jgi:FtsZ-interacting cell division protein ZipA
MGLTVVLTIVGVLAVAALIAAYFYSRRRRSEALKEHFGPEYDRVVQHEKNIANAENILEFREKARQAFQVSPLSPTDQTAFAERWNTVQRQFVDDPPRAVTQADNLLSETLKARGYPVGSFDERAEIVSVDHPVLIQNYRAAHEIALRHAKGSATTEDLRQAMVHYRSLFDELLKDSVIEEDKREARG